MRFGKTRPKDEKNEAVGVIMTHNDGIDEI
jgi:hypothetical protein